MRAVFQLAICTCLIILAGGTIGFVDDGPTFGGGILIIVVWGILFGLIVVTGAFDKVKNSKEVDSPSAERIATLEKRLTDIQEIVIAIDEKLSRVEQQSQPPKTETT